VSTARYEPNFEVVMYMYCMLHMYAYMHMIAPKAKEFFKLFLTPGHLTVFLLRPTRECFPRLRPNRLTAPT
jgi:hypothetical protein